MGAHEAAQEKEEPFTQQTVPLMHVGAEASEPHAGCRTDSQAATGAASASRRSSVASSASSAPSIPRLPCRRARRGRPWRPQRRRGRRRLRSPSPRSHRALTGTRRGSGRARQDRVPSSRADLRAARVVVETRGHVRELVAPSFEHTRPINPAPHRPAGRANAPGPARTAELSASFWHSSHWRRLDARLGCATMRRSFLVGLLGLGVVLGVAGGDPGVGFRFRAARARSRS